MHKYGSAFPWTDQSARHILLRFATSPAYLNHAWRVPHFCLPSPPLSHHKAFQQSRPFPNHGITTFQIILVRSQARDYTEIYNV